VLGVQDWLRSVAPGTEQTLDVDLAIEIATLAVLRIVKPALHVDHDQCNGTLAHVDVPRSECAPQLARIRR
jgi:hypothetical protein